MRSPQPRISARIKLPIIKYGKELRRESIARPSKKLPTCRRYLAAHGVRTSDVAKISMGFELENFVRRGKALSSGGCEPRPTAVAPVGSSQGGLRRQRCRLKHSGDEGPRMAAQQPCGPEREVNAEQASKPLTQKPTLRCLGEGRWQIGKRATYAPICICRGSGASTHGKMKKAATREALSVACTRPPETREGQSGPAGWRRGP